MFIFLLFNTNTYIEIIHQSRPEAKVFYDLWDITGSLNVISHYNQDVPTLLMICLVRPNRGIIGAYAPDELIQEKEMPPMNMPLMKCEIVCFYPWWKKLSWGAKLVFLSYSKMFCPLSCPSCPRSRIYVFNKGKYIYFI